MKRERERERERERGRKKPAATKDGTVTVPRVPWRIGEDGVD